MASRTAPTTIRAIASAQIGLLRNLSITLILFGLRLVCLPSRLDEAFRIEQTVVDLISTSFNVISLTFFLAIIYSVVQLCRALDEGPFTVFYVVATFIPCISLICLLTLSSRATERLQKVGIRVGLLGANIADVESYIVDKESIPCAACGESVEGGAASCPMCDKPIRALDILHQLDNPPSD